MKKFVDYFSSMATSVALLIIFAFSIGYATFIENSQGTPFAREVVYDAVWFEILFIILILNLIGSVFKYEIFNKRKFSVLLFHLAFIVIIAGAAITRYFGSEGVMYIREGQTTNEISSDEQMLKLSATFQQENVSSTEDVALGADEKNEFEKSLKIAGKEIRVETEMFMPNVRETIVPDETGEAALALFVMNAQQEGRDFILQDGDEMNFENNQFSFQKFSKEQLSEGIQFFFQDEILCFTTTKPLMVMQMMQESKPEMIQPNSVQIARERTVYRSGDFTFVLKSYLKNAARNLVQLDDPHQQSSVIQSPQNAVVFRVSDGFSSKRLNLLLSDNATEASAFCTLNGVRIQVDYGNLNKQLPFSIMLRDFQMERYPGSNSPSSYASEITIIDTENKIQQPYRIFMNNILNYRGYRFFQSSYDQDEKGTVLSVSDDFWGTTISYLGYLMLLIGILLNFFNQNSRFRTVIKLSSELQQKRRNAKIITLIAGVVLSVTTLTANSNDVHLSQLNTLLVQDGMQGRIEPFNTFATDVLRKISKAEKVNGQPASLVVVLMMAHPDQWQNEPLIVVKHKDLAKELGAVDGKIAFNQMFDFENGGAYRLTEKVNAAYQKEMNLRTKYDKEIIQLDERINICYQIFGGDLPRLYPDPSSKNEVWLTPAQLAPASEQMSPHHGMMDAMSAMMKDTAVDMNNKSFAVENLILTPEKMHENYLSAVLSGIQSGNWDQANLSLSKIKDYQKTYCQTLPSDKKINLEIFYNEYNIFGKLSYLLMTLGLIFLIFCLWDIFSFNKHFEQGVQLALYAFYVSFGLYSLGLILRWYISDHAPWSNGYETMLFVGWATLLSGLIFARKSPIALATTGILSGIALMVAGMSWMNPEITPLVPVLKSYWLIIHVAVITSSYGFLAMGAILGLVNLLLMISKSKVKNNKKIAQISLSTQEISYIIELSLMIGLLMLTIGCFIGGVWANESWGRYWGWDPKETWALVSIVVYSAILHLRNVPKLNNQFTLSSGALVGFSSIIMTFFGVNYYLSGMHSYGQGTPPPVPFAIYLIVPAVAIIIYMAYKAENNKKLKK